MTVLHFFTLPELCDDLESGTVRVESLVRTINSKTAGVGARIAEVHARAEVRPEVGEPVLMAFMLQVGSIQTLHGEPSNPEAAERLETELDRAGAAVKKYLRDRGFEVRPGLIDLGSAEPVRGTWTGLEDPRGLGVADNGQG